MAKLSIVAGATSQSVNVFVRDSTSTTGGGLASIAPAGGSLLSGTKLDYSFTGASAARVNVSLAVLATVGAAYSSAGIVQIDNTNMIGWIRIDIPNAAITTAKGRVVSFLLWGGTNMAPTPFEIELTGVDNQDAVHFGITGIPNAAAGASGGLLISGSNAGTTTFGALTVTGATTLTGAVSLGSTLGVTGTTTFAAIATGTITTTGNRSISGTTTLTGAVTANNASNNITGVTTTATVQSGTAQAGSANTITLAAGASATNGLYDPGMVRIISGTGAGQARVILEYAGATKVAVVDRDWRVNPDNTSVYEIIATSNLISSNEGLAQAGAGSTITLNANASAVNNSYIGETVTIRAGTGQDQSRNIINYVGATKVATVDAAWSTNPDSTSVYVIWPLGRTTTVALASALDFNATMKTSLNAATPVTTLSSAYDYAKGTVAMTESYAANAAAPTPIQAMFAIHQYLQQFSISTTNYTVKKLDNSTTAFVVTLNDATSPTAAART